jgi:hypothetical protein
MPGESPGRRGDEEEYDEELAALSGPPPSLRHAVIICVILCMSLFMLYLFFPDLSYLLRGVEEPEDLGEAADIVPESLSVNRYVTIHGLPMVHRSIEFKEGIQWFAMSDTTRKLFPLTGQARLFVQWTVPEEGRAYRDPNVNPQRLALPYDFTGHLLDPSFVGGNYDKIWTFYDCLEVYSLRQCKHCLGLSAMAECRTRFTCAENFPADECEILLADEGDGLPDQREELRRLAAQAEYDELGRRVATLGQRVEERRRRIADLDRGIGEAESGAMKERLSSEIADLQRRDRDGDVEKSRVELQIAELGLDPERIRDDVGRLKDDVSGVSSEIDALKREADGYRKEAEELESKQGAERDTALERIAEQIRAELSELEAASAPEGGVDGGSADDAGTAGTDPGGHEPRIAELRGDLAALEAGRLSERRAARLDAIRERLAELGQRRGALGKELGQKEELAQRLADLPREARERTDKTGELRGELAALESGELLEEMGAKKALLAPGLTRMEQVEPRIEALAAKLKQARAGATTGIEAELAELEQAIGPATWILVDDETPGDKIWVVAVYVVFLVMIGFNLRRLYRFWIAWRA